MLPSDAILKPAMAPERHVRPRPLFISSRAIKQAMKLPKSKSPAPADRALKGWTAIARYLGIPVTTAHRWASEGMPVRREGRVTVADREAVSAWLGRESHMPKPAHVMPEDADMPPA